MTETTEYVVVGAFVVDLGVRLLCRGRHFFMTYHRDVTKGWNQLKRTLNWFNSAGRQPESC